MVHTDMSEFALTGVVEIETPYRRRRASLEKTLFVKGPFPIPWLKACQVAYPNSIFVAYAILLRTHKSIVDLEQGWVVASDALVSSFGLSKPQRQRALRSMQQAGLIEVARCRGGEPGVRLIPWVNRKQHEEATSGIEQPEVWTFGVGVLRHSGRAR